MFRKILFLITICTIYTANSGNNWELLNPPGSSAFTAIFSLDTLISVGVGAQNTIIKTTDGGNNWYFPNVPQTPLVQLYSITFNKSGIGIAGGSGGNLFYSTDKGENWSLSSIPTSGTIYSLRFLDDSTVLAISSLISSGEIFYSTDSGKQWFKIYSINQGISSIYFNSPSTGFVVGNRGIILKTFDRGQTWFLDTTNKYQYDFSKIFLLDSLNGWIIGTNGVVLKTSDGGNKWELLPSPKSTDYLLGIHFTSLNEGWVYSFQGRLFYTTDGGNNWSIDFEGSNPYSYLFDIAFPSQNLGFVVGGNNIILRLRRILSAPNISESTPKFHLIPIDGEYLLSGMNLKNRRLKISLMDLFGNILILYDGLVSNQGMFNFRFSTSLLSSGIYLLVVNQENYFITLKLTISK